MIATGASQLARKNVGTPVFGGMIAASFIGIFVIPPLYVLFQGLRERAWRILSGKEKKTPAGQQIEGASGTPGHLPAE